MNVSWYANSLEGKRSRVPHSISEVISLKNRKVAVVKSSWTAGAGLDAASVSVYLLIFMRTFIPTPLPSICGVRRTRSLTNQMGCVRSERVYSGNLIMNSNDPPFHSAFSNREQIPMPDLFPPGTQLGWSQSEASFCLRSMRQAQVQMGLLQM